MSTSNRRSLASSTLPGLIWLLASTMTMLVGVALAPALPGMRVEFASTPNAEWLVKMALGAPALTIGLCSFPVGLWLNRHSRRKTFLTGLAGCGLLGLAGFFVDSLTWIVALRVLMGACATMALVSSTTMIGDHFKGPELNRWLSFQTFAVGLGGIAYLPLAGVLASHHWRLTFAMYTIPLVLFALAFAIVPEIRREAPAAAAPGTTATGQSNAKAASDSHPLRAPLLLVYALVLFCGLAFFALPAHLPFAIQERLGLGPKSIGFALGLSWVGFCVSSLACGIWKPSPSQRPFQIGMYLLMGAGFATLASVSASVVSWSTILVGVVLIGAGLGMVYPYMSFNLLSRSSPASRGVAIGIYTACNFGSQFLSPLVTHPIAKVAGVGGVYLALASVFLCLALVAGFLIRTPNEVRA